MFHGKKILIGVCGSIAAYKTAYLIRLLIKEGAEVKVIMTPSALDFITPLTLSTLSRNPVLSDFFKEQSGEWHSHVELGLWADLFLIAPASANTMAKMASGTCDNLLLATYLSARCPVMLAPAMDLDMYKHPITQENVSKLKTFGNTFIETEYGELASGLTGEGRMAEPENILRYLSGFFKKKDDLSGFKALVTAGPTYENIDPVRFVGNYSSGRMGYRIAEELASRGAEVVLISGPSSLSVKKSSINTISVTSANEMFDACKKHHQTSNIAVFAAAVSDYRPLVSSTGKIKKTDRNITITLEKNPDIAYELGKKKKKDQFHIGFALETENELENARTKLKNKNFDFIVLNSMQDEGAGFSHATNKITIIDKNNQQTDFSLKTKEEVASDIVEYYLKLNTGV